MAEQRMHLPAPPAIDAERIKDPRYTILARSERDGAVLVHFDPQQQCGALFHLACEIWTIWGTLQFDAFIASLAPRGVAVDESADLHTWVETCSAGMVLRPVQLN